MDLGLAGRKAILTGSTKGLGFACAMALAKEGAEVTIVGRDPARLAAAAEKIRAETGAAVHPVAGDVTRPDARAAILAACPQPDILLNNAAGFPPGDFRQWDRDVWIAALDLMMLAPIEMIRLVVDGMMERGFGRIVSITSRSVKIAQLELGLSNGARSGLVGFTAGLARQAARRGVTVNNLLPGIFDTDAQREHIEGMLDDMGQSFDQVWQQRADGNPTGRYGRAEELGAYFAFLCSQHAGFITGQNLLIDGGSYPGTY